MEGELIYIEIINVDVQCIKIIEVMIFCRSRY